MNELIIGWNDIRTARAEIVSMWEETYVLMDDFMYELLATGADGLLLRRIGRC